MEQELIKAIANVGIVEKLGETASESGADIPKDKAYKKFYSKARKYWSRVPPTVNGMLGGLGFISTVDINGSRQFIGDLELPNRRHALDCGAGIGRVTKHLLVPLFECVDLVEQDGHFTKAARAYCKSDKVGQIFKLGLQEFTPAEEKYDLIWSQWVLGHLPDDDLLEFFKRVRKGLTKEGYFVMKDNVSSCGEVDMDEKDASFTRPLEMYTNILEKSGMEIIKVTEQQDFPKGLYPVYMIACRPKT